MIKFCKYIASITYKIVYKFQDDSRSQDNKNLKLSKKLP